MSRHILIAMVVGSAYALASQLSFAWFDADGVNASFFPAAGVTMAALIMLERRDWPLVLLAVGVAELVIDLLHSIPLAAALGYVVANLAQPIVGAGAVRRYRRHLDIARLVDLAAFLLCGVVVGPLVGGMLGATTNVLLHDGSDWFRFVGQWWVGDGLGVLVAGGTILALWSGRDAVTRRRPWEPLLLIGGTATVTLVGFGTQWFALLYLPLVMLFLIAVRLGTAGVALSGAAVAFIAAEATSRGNRLWTVLDVSDSAGLVYMQLALAIIIASALVVAAGLAEREVSTAAYTISEASRREADLARLRAELLWELAEELAQASAPAEIATSLRRRQLQEAWPRGVPWPALDAGTHDSSDGLEPRRNDVTDHRSVRDSAVRMTRDALQRVRLVAEETMARERAELLEQHAANLAAAATPAEVAEVTVRAIASLGADCNAVWELNGNTMQMLAMLDTRPGSGDVPRSVAIDLDVPVTDCARSGQILSFATQRELTERYSQQTELLRNLRSGESVVAVPLNAVNGAVTGVMVVADGTPHWFTDRQRQLVVGLARQCGLALDRSILQSKTVQAAIDADELVRFGERLDKATTVHDRAQCVADELVRAGAVSVEVELASGHSVNAGHHPGAEPAGVDTLIAPLHARGQMVGHVRITGENVLTARGQLVRDIVSRAAIAIDNAQLYEVERDASHRLQLGLLDSSIPEVDDCRIDVAYRPGTASLDVGGDWHDAFRLPNGSLGLVVGDVVGHGLDAAAAMAQLRGAVRGLAAVSSPAQLLDRLDWFVDSLPAAFMTTLVYVELEPSTGAMRYACAGHPPPLIVSSHGVTRLLWDARSAPLGSSFMAHRVESVDRLHDGERLVLYTDGLIERRYEAIDVGLERLVRATQHDVSTPNFVERLCKEMANGPAGDDICILTVALVRDGSFATFVASKAHELSRLRGQLRTWLSSVGCDPEAAADIVLAASEAASNAIEHGAAEMQRGVSVVGRVVDDVISIVIRDHGRWREPGPPMNRGRGLMIMRYVMDTVSVEPGDDGTVVRLERALN